MTSNAQPAENLPETSDIHSEERRFHFLLEMYKETSAHLNRHILVTWQSIGVVVGALAVFGLGDKFGVGNDARLDFVTAVVTVVCAWAIAHVYDANNWFDRNLHIISNIERQFLKQEDLKNIHPYFLSHRREVSSKELLLHFQIQALMPFALWLLIMAYHFWKRVWPGFQSPITNLELVRAMPYMVAAASVAYCLYVILDTRKGYKALAEKSPGKAT